MGSARDYFMDLYVSDKNKGFTQGELAAFMHDWIHDTLKQV